ncbi:MAG: serine/threonine protein kinase [Burkholderiaceae bacterium]
MNETPPRRAEDEAAPDRAAPDPVAPFHGLTPDALLDALASIGVHGDGRLIALNSYENRVYQVYLEEAAPVVVKFYRPQRWNDAQILEEHGFARELAAAEIPVVAPSEIDGRTLHAWGGHRFAVFPRHGGRAPEFDDPDVLEWTGRFIARIHTVGARAPFRERPGFDVTDLGDASRDWLLEQGFIPTELVVPWRTAVDQALDGVRRAFDRAGDVRMLRVHGDCHQGNLLWTDTGPHFVDLDDARNGPAVQDLWMMLSGDRASMTRQLSDLVAGYEDFGELDRRELHLVEALRTLRLIHYQAWLARRWHDPAFPAAFPWFGTQRYWEDRVLEIREQIAANDEAPLVV